MTIEGVTAVVDTGLARQMQFDADIGLDRLELTPVSKASTDQRAGRAGRTEPGICLRLWEEATQRHRPDFDVAELHRVDLSSAFCDCMTGAKLTSPHFRGLKFLLRRPSSMLKNY